MQEHLNNITRLNIELLDLLKNLYESADMPIHIVMDKLDEIAEIKSKLESYL